MTYGPTYVEREFNPTTQFQAERIVKHDGELYALSNGVWLSPTNEHQPFTEDGLNKVVHYFRDYWKITSYDWDCEHAREIRNSETLWEKK